MYVVTLAELEESAKIGVVTVNPTAVVRVSPAPLPMIVIVELPAARVAATVIVAVTGASVVSVAEEKFTVTPDGMPLAERVTGALNPEVAVKVRFTVPELPCVTDTLGTLGLNEKSTLAASLQ